MNEDKGIPPEVTEARLRITEQELWAGEELSSLLTVDEIAALQGKLASPLLIARLDRAVEAQRAEAVRRYATTDPGMPLDSHCARCQRPAPPDDHPDAREWEAWQPNGSNVVLALCPDCVTPEERQATDEEFMEFLDEVDPGWFDRDAEQ